MLPFSRIIVPWDVLNDEVWWSLVLKEDIPSEAAVGLGPVQAWGPAQVGMYGVEAQGVFTVFVFFF